MVTIEELVQERQWMYNQRSPGETLNTDVFMYGVGYFLQVAIRNGQICDGNKLRCPCSKCKNKHVREIGLCETHLFTYGFVKDYYNWTNHGEEIAEVSSSWDNNINNFQDQNDEFFGQGIDSRFGDMVSDIAGPSTNYDQPQSAEPEEPNQAASQLYDLLKSSCQPVFEGCTSETQLSIAMKMLQIKTDHGLSEAAYDSICATIGNLLDCEHLVPTTFRETKKFVSGLGMGYIRIDVCVNGCMIYYGGDENLSTCRYCGDPRYKETRKQQSSRSYTRISRSQMFYLPIIPRIQRLYMNEITAEHMTWHANTDRDPDVMVHPADGESWKHFDRINPDFSSELRNVRLGLCSDGFSPFGMSAKSYSCWPVMLTPYNLPPWMCMKTRYMWLTVLIPGPRNPKKRIDIYLRPLIDDLLILWNYGVQTFDSYNKQNFNMRAVLMWTVSDFPAYGMLSGWSTQGRLGCPYCREDTKTFVLKNGRKVSYFDCHRRFLPVGHPYRENHQSFYYGREEHNSPVIFLNGHAVYERVCHLKTIFEQIPDEKLPGYGIHHNWTKKSIFWELPYWKDMLLRHNLDVMHIEKNVFENLFNTIMNVKGKTKDNGAKCRKDVALYCDRPELELVLHRGKMIGAKAKYALNVEQQEKVYHWITGLQFPDGYASRLGNHVDLQQRKLMGYKTHDAHVFLERLMPIAFRGMLPIAIWESVSELCTFFRDLCASSLDVHRMTQWKANIIETICKLETFFPPSFFDSMEHLPIHVADEILLGGPVHYRWMYPFERFIYRLKRMAKNKASVEAAIVNAYIQQETAFFGSDYLGPEFKTNARRLKRNEVLRYGELSAQISIFNHPGSGSKIIKRRVLTSEEFWKATHYAYINTPEFENYISRFQSDIQQMHPQISFENMEKMMVKKFPKWMQNYVWTNYSTELIPDWIQEISMGFDWSVRCMSSYKVNNYKFITELHSRGRQTKNCHVHVKGLDDVHYYGVLEEIIEFKTRTPSNYKLILFKCRWFDPNNVHRSPALGIVEVNTRILYGTYDPFILAQQAEQVYFTEFPGLPGKSRQGWVAVCRVKPTNAIDMSIVDFPFQENGDDDMQLPIVNHMVTLSTIADNEFTEYSDVEDDDEDDETIHLTSDSESDEPDDESDELDESESESESDSDI